MEDFLYVGIMAGAFIVCALFVRILRKN